MGTSDFHSNSNSHSNSNYVYNLQNWYIFDCTKTQLRTIWEAFVFKWCPLKQEVASVRLKWMCFFYEGGKFRLQWCTFMAHLKQTLCIIILWCLNAYRYTIKINIYIFTKIWTKLPSLYYRLETIFWMIYVYALYAFNVANNHILLFLYSPSWKIGAYSICKTSRNSSETS